MLDDNYASAKVAIFAPVKGACAYFEKKNQMTYDKSLFKEFVSISVIGVLHLSGEIFTIFTIQK